MDKLTAKYLDNTLSQEELLLLRKEAASQSDDELEALMLEDWRAVNVLQTPPVHDVPVRIHKKLEMQLSHSSAYALVFKVAAIAASLLVPILLISTFYFYNESTLIANQDVVIQTGKGERVNVTLPDGTSVYINTETKLSYNPKTFNKKHRQVTFDGEGYFSVSHNIEAPFKVSSDGMQLKVLGTKFNLRARENQSDIFVDLLEGHVALQSNVSANFQELFANESALFNKNTGVFNVSKRQNNQVIAWVKGDLVFNNLPLKEVVESIERNYNVKFEISSKKFNVDDIFTGTLPINNIFEVIEILQKTYNVKCVLKNNIIVVHD